MHLPVFIRDLAVILMTAGVTSLLFRWLKQPVILGYVVAGVLIGPHVPFTATVHDMESVRVWGEIGVIFVLFGLGLEFSFRRLLHVGGPALITAGIETSILLVLGTLLGLALGWSKMDAVFLGGMLGISSTIIITKVFEELGLKTRNFTALVLGVLIVEDLVAVLLLVLLSTLAVTRQLGGSELAFAALRLGFFITLWFVIGLFALPTLMRMLRKLLSEETTLIFAVGLCLMMVLIATESGFSPALGAFVMGSLLAETDERRRIEHVLHPLRNFFGAVFFVSVGMLFNPRSLIELWPAVLAISLLVIFGKTLAVSFGALVAGQNSRAALFSGVSMTQIGEFSFIIASLGLSLHVISERLYPIAVAVSLITSCLTPLWLKRAGKIHEWIEKIMPWGLRQGMQRYEDTVRINRGRGALPSLLSAYLPPIVVNLVMILATTGIARALLYPQIEAMWGPSPQVRLLGLLAGFALGLPFYWGLCLGRPAKSWREKAHEFPRLYWVEMFLALARIGLALMLFLFSVAQYLSWKSLSGLTIFMLLGSAALFYAFGGKIYVRLEKRFLGQLKPGAEDKAPEPALLPWDTHLTELVVAPESQACGKTILNMGLGESFGVMIAAIDRGRRRILAPKGSDFVFPGDKLSVIGGDADIERLRRLVEGVDGIAEPEQPLALQSVILSADSELRGKSIRESQLRDRVHGLLVGIERKGYRQLNPSPDLRLEAGDRLWIVGDAQRIAELNP